MTVALFFCTATLWTGPEELLGPGKSAWAQEAEGGEAPPAAAADKLIPDPALEAAVREQVFAKRYNQEPLTKDDVKDISQVVAIGKGIKSLEGLQHCLSLRLIRLTDNEIKDLQPIAELKLLQSIDLAGNKIEDITPLKELERVQLLELSGNQIKQLDAVTKMTNMRSLWVADNQIESLAPLSGLKKIGSLDVAGNGLEDADLAPVGQLAWLTHLNVDRNQLKSLAALGPLRELSMVLARENQLADLTAVVEMCRKDVAGSKQFAPYLRLYLAGNPLSDDAKNSQVSALREMGVEVEL